MKKISATILAVALMLPGLALAHTGSAQTTGFMAGVGHPLSGIDHILAMVAVGLWASKNGGRSMWVIPCTFVGAMIMGCILGIAGVSVPFVEEGIVVSVLVLGVLIAGAFRLSIGYASVIVGLFAILHGHAHGAEISEALGAASYMMGFSLTSAMLHLIGIGVTTLFPRSSRQPATRCMGAVLAVGGLILSVS